MEVIDGETDRIGLIAKRDIERKLGVQKRKDDKSSLTAENEKLGYFQDTFNKHQTQIEDLLRQSDKVDKQGLPDHFNNISKEILLLQKYAANSNIFLRSYDIKKCQESIHDLTTKLKELEEELLPKKRFGFKNKNRPKAEKSLGQDEVDFHKTITFTKQLLGFRDKIGETFTMHPKEIHKKDITMEKLENCTVEIFGSPSTLHLNYLKNCRVVTGPVSTSIFAENCTDCTLVIACQQLRLHSSNNVKIYLHVTSRAIMEDCHKIYLAPYNLKYEGLDEDFKESGLDQGVNNWKCVDDFNWLNVERQSPNWALLDE